MTAGIRNLMNRLSQKFETKLCRHCFEHKALGDFSTSREHDDWCEQCVREYNASNKGAAT